MRLTTTTVLNGTRHIRCMSAAVALVAAVLAHTPLTFNRDCTTVHLHDLNVSQVHYMVLHNDCTHRFLVDSCQFEILSLHRFHLHQTDAFLRIGNQTWTENAQTATGEPFTVTPIVTTLELEDLHRGPDPCVVEVGSTAHIAPAMLVSGRAEEPWLFLTIPYWSAVIQHSWAFDDLSTAAALWPWYVQLVLIAMVQWLFPRRQTREYVPLGHPPVTPRYVPMCALVLASVTVDQIVPYARTSVRIGEFPGSGMWVGVLIARLFITSVLLYLVYKYEGEHTNGIDFRQLPAWRKALLVVGWLLLYAACIGLNVGGYFLLPYMAWRYRQRHNPPAAEADIMAPDEGCVPVIIDSDGKLTLQNLKFTGRLKLV